MIRDYRTDAVLPFFAFVESRAVIVYIGTGNNVKLDSCEPMTHNSKCLTIVKVRAQISYFSATL